MQEEWIAIAVVKRPVGLEGFCAVEPFGGTFGSLRTPGIVRLGKDLERAKSATITDIVALPKEFRCRFAGSSDRTAVEGLRGHRIYIEQTGLPPRKTGTFYHFELLGMAVFGDSAGERIGTVIEVHNFPSVDTLEVELAKGPTVLLPLMDLAIVAIDRTAGKITARESYIEALLD